MAHAAQTCDVVIKSFIKFHERRKLGRMRLHVVHDLPSYLDVRPAIAVQLISHCPEEAVTIRSHLQAGPAVNLRSLVWMRISSHVWCEAGAPWEDRWRACLIRSPIASSSVSRELARHALFSSLRAPDFLLLAGLTLAFNFLPMNCVQQQAVPRQVHTKERKPPGRLLHTFHYCASEALHLDRYVLAAWPMAGGLVASKTPTRDHSYQNVTLEHIGFQVFFVYVGLPYYKRKRVRFADAVTSQSATPTARIPEILSC